MRLCVEDSPNLAGVAIDLIRYAKLELNRGQVGILYTPSAYFCKHFFRRFTDDEAFQMTEKLIKGE